MLHEPLLARISVIVVVVVVVVVVVQVILKRAG